MFGRIRNYLLWILLGSGLSLYGQSLQEVVISEDFVVEVSGWGFPDGLPSVYISNLYPASSGMLFFNAPKAGNFRFDGNSFKRIPIFPLGKQEPLPGALNRHTTFYEDGEGQMYFVFQSALDGPIIGITVTDYYGQAPRPFYQIGDGDTLDLRLISGRYKTITKEKRLYLESLDGLQSFVFDGTFRKLAKADIPSFSLDHYSQESSYEWSSQYNPLPILVVNNDYDLERGLDGKCKLFFRGRVLTNDLEQLPLFDKLKPSGRAIATDHNTFWWTSDTKLLRLSFKPKLFEEVNFGLSAPSVRGIIPVADSDLLISTYKGDFWFASESTEIEPINYKFSSKRPIVKTAVAAESYWIGRENGLYRSHSLRNPKDIERVLPNTMARNIYDLIVLDDSNILFASNNGVCQFNIPSAAVTRSVLPGQTVHKIYRTKNGEVWLGTNQGVFNWSTSDTHLTAYKIFDMLEDQNGIVWLATEQGLLEWEPGARTYRQHLWDVVEQNNRLHCVHTDANDNFWLSTNHGIIVYNPKLNRKRIFYDKDGLPGNEFNQFAHYQNDEGILFFGGTQGLVKINPERFSWNTSPSIYPMRWQHLNVYDRQDSIYLEKVIVDTTQIEKVIELPQQSERVEVTFDFPNFDRQLVKRQWKLSGSDHWWDITAHNDLSFRYADYGEKTLSLRVVDRQTAEVIQLLELRLVKRRPFYKSLPFFVILSALIGILVYVVTYYLGQLEKRRLRYLVATQTQDLQLKAKRLNDKNDELKAIQENRNRLFNNLSHDLRTPLFVIKAVCERGLLDEATKLSNTERFSTISNNANLLNDLVGQIADLQLREAKLVQLQKSWVDWRLLCEETVENMRPLADKKAINVRITELPEPKSYIWIDLIKTRQIIQNLLDNAIKYTPENGNIEFQSALTSAHINFTVADSGPGISWEERKKIFNRFYQGSAAESPSLTGLGLGLSFCKDYVALMGGEIKVGKSRLGGALFKAYIKREQHEQNRTPKSSGQVASGVSPVMATVNKKRTILIAEDNKDLLRLYQEVLEHEYELLIAENGKVALEIVSTRQHNVDLFLLDLMMPKIDGLELLTHLKEHPQYAMTPIIVLTAVKSHAVKLKALRVGVDSYLTKPFTMEELQVRVSNLLRYQQFRFEEEAQINTEYLENEGGNVPALLTIENEWLAKLEQIIFNHLDDPSLRVNTIATELHISERSLRKKIKSLTGLKPNEYLVKIRLAKALELLEERRYRTVSEVCYNVGMKSPSNFTRLFKEEFGKLPSSYLLN